MNIIRLTTEGDCEGRTTKTVGYFKGTTEQILTYCVLNNIKPYYQFKKTSVDIVDCSNIKAAVTVKERDHGYLQYETTEDLHRKSLVNAALSKLSDKEKELLGLNK